MTTIGLGRYVHTDKSGLIVGGADYALGDFKVFEEKGSDVNVATHLLVDVLGGKIDAAVVFSNDSDLALPISRAREIVPVGLINPSTRPTAFHLKADAGAGVGRHWWRRLDMIDLVGHQLADPCGSATKPRDW